MVSEGRKIYERAAGLRGPLLWKRWLNEYGPTLMGLMGIVAAFGFVIWVLVLTFVPSTQWDDAVVVRICHDGTPILKLRDGTIWARRTLAFGYRVEDAEKVCDR
jgi:hypothetical protein